MTSVTRRAVARWRATDDVVAHHLATTENAIFQLRSHRFGHRRRGDVDLLRAMGDRLGFGVSTVTPRRDESGLVCSSTRVRTALAEGRLDDAAAVLGRPCEVRGKSVRLSDGTVTLPIGSHQRPRAGTYDVAVTPERGNSACWTAARRAAVHFSDDTDPPSAFVFPRDGWVPPAPELRVRVLGLLMPEAGNAAAGHTVVT
jgi:riboflavin kinase/FMN adenylyltransferase